jgi:hypothetical protein
MKTDCFCPRATRLESFHLSPLPAGGESRIRASEGMEIPKASWRMLSPLLDTQGWPLTSVLSPQTGRGGLGESAEVKPGSVWRAYGATVWATCSQTHLSLYEREGIKVRDCFPSIHSQESRAWGGVSPQQGKSSSKAQLYAFWVGPVPLTNERRNSAAARVPIATAQRRMLSPLLDRQGWPLTSVLSPQTGRGGLGESAEIKPGSIWRAYGGMVWATCSQTRLSLCQRERIKVRDCSSSAPPGRTRLLSEQCRVPHGPGDSKTGQLQCLSRRGTRERIKVRDCSGASVPSAANPSVVGRGPAREPD